MTRNQIDYWRLQEDKRHQRSVEEETARANRRQERLKREATYADMVVRRKANLINDSHLARMDTETNRHNLETERLQALMHQNELARITLGYDQMANQRGIAQISAGVGYAQVGAQYASVAEQQRANQARESLQLMQQQEQMRSNMAHEAVARQNATSAQTQANTARMKQQFEELKWNQIGKQKEYQQTALLGAQMLQTWAQTDYTKTQTVLNRVETASNALVKGSEEIRSWRESIINGGKKNAKPQVQWPDGSISQGR